MFINLPPGKHRICSPQKMIRLKTKLLTAFLFIYAAGCSPAEIIEQTQTREPIASVAPTHVKTSPTIEPDIVESQSNVKPQIGYTHFGSDGNRLIQGVGSLPSGTSIEIRLEGTPVWVVAVPYQDSSLWAVILEDGGVQGFQIDTQSVTTAQITPDHLNPQSPPLLYIEDGKPKLAVFSSADQSPSTHAIYLPAQGKFAFINSNGALTWIDQSNQILGTVEINALPDARILSDDDDRLLLLSGPTTQYDHGVLGDIFEATSITLLETTPNVRVVNIINMPDGQVIEGIAPIWADLNGDGEREIIVTLSDGINGAQLVVYSEDGEQLIFGDAIGQGYRWRHQIAAAPFGPTGEIEIVDVLTPHLGGVVEFFQVEGERLLKVAQIGGFTSHVIGSRNLDMAAAGDFDGDGNYELLLPNQARTEIGAIQRTPKGAELVWSLALDGQMSTNLGAVTLKNGLIMVGIGRTDDVLKIWLP